MAALEHMTGTPQIEHTVAFSSETTPLHPTIETVQAPTLIPPDEDTSHSDPSPSPTSAPTLRPDPHIGPTLIPPDDHTSSTRQIHLCPNNLGLHEDESPGSTSQTQASTDDPSHLPPTEPITEYFQLPTLEDPNNEDTDEQ